MQLSVTPLSPVMLGAGKVHYAQGVAAGPWVFATGHMAQNYRDGLSPDVLADLPERLVATRFGKNI